MLNKEIIYIRPHQIYQLEQDLRSGRVDPFVAQTHGEEFSQKEQQILDLLLSDPCVLLQFDVYSGTLCVPECKQRERLWHRCDNFLVWSEDEAIAERHRLPLDEPIPASIVFPFLIRK